MNGPRVRNCDIGRDIIQWGERQSDEGVAQTLARIGEINQQTVQMMISHGLQRSWVEDQLGKYRKAAIAQKKHLNKQLLPRIELMEAILRKWP